MLHVLLVWFGKRERMLSGMCWGSRLPLHHHMIIQTAGAAVSMPPCTPEEGTNITSLHTTVTPTV